MVKKNEVFNEEILIELCEKYAISKARGEKILKKDLINNTNKNVKKSWEWYFSKEYNDCNNTGCKIIKNLLR